jgi:hypothetical protein
VLGLKACTTTALLHWLFSFFFKDLFIFIYTSTL